MGYLVRFGVRGDYVRICKRVGWDYVRIGLCKQWARPKARPGLVLGWSGARSSSLAWLA